MGLPCSRPAAGALFLDSVTPEDLQKGNPDACQEIESKAELEAQASNLTPPPSVVIAWVLSDVLMSDPFSTGENERLKREAQFEAHAERLGNCWATHGDDFVKSFAEELMACLQDLRYQYNYLSTLTDFLARLFGACRSDPSLLITRGSDEIWPTSILEEFCRKHEQLSKGAEWAEPATTRWRNSTSEFLRYLDCSLPYSNNENFTEVTGKLRKAVENVRSELSIEQTRVKQAQEKAKKDAKEAQLRARRALFKSTLKKAPWEKGALAGEKKA